jgi:hypothetical protein
MGDGHGVIAFPGISIQGFPYQHPFRPLTHFYLAAITLLGDFNGKWREGSDKLSPMIGI